MYQFIYNRKYKCLFEKKTANVLTNGFIFFLSVARHFDYQCYFYIFQPSLDFESKIKQ